MIGFIKEKIEMIDFFMSHKEQLGVIIMTFLFLVSEILAMVSGSTKPAGVLQMLKAITSTIFGVKEKNPAIEEEKK